MHNVFIIIQREFLERVRTRSFVLGTVLFPLFMVGMIFLPTLIKSGGGERRLVVVDSSPAGIGERTVAALQAPKSDKNAIRYTIERVAGPFEPIRDQLNGRVTRKEIDGYLVIGPDILQSSEITYRARDVTKVQVVDDIQTAVSGAVQQERLRGRGLTAAQVAELVRNVKVQAARITGGGEERGNLMATLMTSYVLMFLFIQLITLYGQNAMRSVLEEKNNRIVEVIVSSVRPTHLMAGKILGLASVALTQIAIWLGFVLLLSSQSEMLTRRFGVSAGAFGALDLDPSVWAIVFVFFTLGFVLYAAMYAAAGSTVTSEQEAQQLAFPMMLPLFVPIMFIMPVLTDPLGQTARTLSFIPFTAPVVLPMRAVATDVPAWEVGTSVVLLLIGVAAVMWLAGKIYRIGILSTGKKPTLRELGRWLRAA